MVTPTQRRQKVRIGDLLVQERVISEAQLQMALAEQKKSGRKLGRVFVELGLTSEEQILQILSSQLNIPFVDLKHFNFKPEVIKRLPETHARRYRCMVLDEKPGGFVVGMADPTDIFAFDELGRLLPKPVSTVLVRESDLLLAIDTVYRRTQEIVSLAEELGEELGETDYDIARLAVEDNQADAPVIKLLQSLFEDAVQVSASDIHIEPDESVLRIRQRVDGMLQEQVIDNRRITGALVTKLKLMAGLDIAEKRLPQDGRFTMRVKSRTLDVRLSTMPVQHGETVVMRLLDQSASLLQLNELGMPAAMLRRFISLIQRPSGMLLVTGPTGSGKTTTLYSALNRINREDTKIITVEDPVEYRLPRISQVQVHPKIGLDFARVLRTALRQDPDVIMIGEIRDKETAEIALRAAITGHFVLSTLHTTDAIATVNRLIDMGAEGYMIASALDAVIAQRLVRRVCDSCEQPYAPGAKDRAFAEGLLGTPLPANIALKRGAGCTYCSGTGYRGRVGVYELLEMNANLASAVRDRDSNAFARHLHEQKEYRPLVAVALDYALQGITSLDEVRRLAGTIDEFRDADLLGDPLQHGLAE
jgi:MSHA biogenesis protein MshE